MLRKAWFAIVLLLPALPAPAQSPSIAWPADQAQIVFIKGITHFLDADIEAGRHPAKLQVNWERKTDFGRAPLTLNPGGAL